MDMYGFNQNGNRGDYYFGEPRWDDFTIDDEKRARSRFSRFFLALSVYLIVSSSISVLATLIVSFAFGERATEIIGSMWFTWGLQIAAMYIIAFPILFLITKSMRSTVRVKSKMRFGEFFKLLCISEALMLAGNLIGELTTSILDVFIPGEITDPLQDLIMQTPVWIIILVAVIIGPIVEELIFRKFLMDKLGIYGDRIAIVVSSIAFGLFHGNISQFFYATFFGFMLSYIYSKTSNIIYPIIMHMVINFIGSVLPMPVIATMERYSELTELYTQAMSGENATAAVEEFMSQHGDEFLRLAAINGTYSIIVYGLVITGIVFLIKNRRRFFVSDRCEVLIPKRRRADIIIVNVGAIIFLVVTSISMILNILPIGT